MKKRQQAAVMDRSEDDLYVLEDEQEDERYAADTLLAASLGTLRWAAWRRDARDEEW